MKGALLAEASKAGPRVRMTDAGVARGTVTAVALSSVLALAGCGGGGGGGGPASTLVPSVLNYQYPSSLSSATSADTIGGSMAPYATDSTTTTPGTELQSALPSGLSATEASGKLTITVSAIQLPSPDTAKGPEPAFVVTFDPTTTTFLSPSNSPFDATTPACSGCLRTATAPATYVGGGPAGDVTFTYLDPNSTSFPLKYSTLGMWTKLTTVGATTWTEVGGPFSAGVLTRGIDLPTTGTANYSGYFIGRYVTSDTTIETPALPAPGTYLVGANANATVDFSGLGAVTFSTTHTQISQELGSGVLALPVSESRLDLSTNAGKAMTITRTITSNSFTGGAGTLTNGMNMGGTTGTGQIGGSFYGPASSTSAPPEMGGALAVSNPGGSQNLVGSFGALKQ